MLKNLPWKCLVFQSLSIGHPKIQKTLRRLSKSSEYSNQLLRKMPSSNVSTLGLTVIWNEPRQPI